MSDPRPRVAGVRFANAGKISYFDPAGMRLETGEYVVVTSNRGPELARVVIAPGEVVVDEMKDEDLPPVLRLAGAADIERATELQERAKEVLIAARRLASELDFRGALQKAEFTLDGRRLTLHFESPERVDYREFARRAAREFDCRVDMHNLGPRDRARLAGGYGICGRELCCSNWLQSFPSISIRMAKEQDKPLNPEKISGLCGRLLCCLSYEEEGYKEMRRTLPKLGHRVSTPTGEGRVVAVNILKRAITIAVNGQRLDIPDRDLGTVVRWDPASKANEPPPSMTRAEGVSQGLVESDELDDDPDAAEWPPRSARFGRLPVQAVAPSATPAPAARRPSEQPDTREDEQRPARRRRRGGGRQEARTEQPAQPDKPRSRGRRLSETTPPAGRSKPFKRQQAEDAPERTPPPAPRDADAEPRASAEGEGRSGGRRRGRRGGRRRRGGGGGDAGST